VDYTYDSNGNTVQKTRTRTGTVLVTYKNLNDKKLTYHLKNGAIVGPAVDFAPTGSMYKTVMVGGVSLGAVVGFCVTPDEVSSYSISIEKMTGSVSR